MRKKILISLGVFCVLFIGFLFWYQATYSMGKIDGYEVNNTSMQKKVLIASQGSEYKLELTKRITDHFKTIQSIFKVVDVDFLPKVKPDEWDAIIIIHTWEIWKPESNSKEFIDKSFDPTKMYVVTTSGAGDEQIEGVDGITGASDLTEISSHTKIIFDWLSTLLFK